MLEGIKNLISSVTGGEVAGGAHIENIDAQVFYSQTHRQTGYDREIDEGMSSGMRRFCTIDVTGMSQAEVSRVISKLTGPARDFNISKQVQIAGFNNRGKRYVVASGESHLHFQGAAARYFTERAERALAGMPAKFVGYVAFPAAASVDVFEPVNLGPYGSTGAPMMGIEKNPAANPLPFVVPAGAEVKKGVALQAAVSEACMSVAFSKEVVIAPSKKAPGTFDLYTAPKGQFDTGSFGGVERMDADLWNGAVTRALQSGATVWTTDHNYDDYDIRTHAAA